MTPRDLTMEEREELNRMMKSGFSPSQKKQEKEQYIYAWMVCARIGEMARATKQNPLKNPRRDLQSFCESVLLHGRLNEYSDKDIEAAIEKALGKSSLEALKEKVSVVPPTIIPDKYSIFKKTRERQFADAKREAEMLMSIRESFKKANKEVVLGELRAEFQKENPNDKILTILCDRLKDLHVKGYSDIESVLPDYDKDRQKAITKSLVVIDLIEDRFYERGTEMQLAELEKRYANLGENGQKGPEGDYLRTQIEITRVKYRAEQKAAEEEMKRKRSASIRRQYEEEALEEERKTAEWKAGAQQRAEKAKQAEIDSKRRREAFEKRKLINDSDYFSYRAYRKTGDDKDLM